MRPVELESEQLRLRPWRNTDLAPFALMNADPAVMAHFPKLLTRQESDALAARIQAEFAERGWGLWAVEVKGGEPFIGIVGLSIPEARLPFAPCVEIGWRLASAQWGHGYATEAARQALRCAFDDLRLAEVVSFTASGNWRSRRVMAQLGMGAAMQFEHPGLPAGHPLRQHVLYRMADERWHQLHG